jgi:His-Xaa-Ser system protein HxsD
MSEINLPWAKETELSWVRSGKTYILTVDTAIYSTDAVLKTCYLFLDQCYFFLSSSGSEETKIDVYATQIHDSDMESVLGQFANQLTLQEVRQKVAAETQVIREIIVAQALTEGDVLDHSAMEADYNFDPQKIAD